MALNGEKIFDSFTDLLKIGLPLALDKPGGSKISSSNQAPETVAPIDTVKNISGAPAGLTVSQTTMLIGGVILAGLVVYMVVRK